MDNMSDKKMPFYSKFVDEEKLKKINDQNILDKFFVYSYSVVFLTGPSCFLPFFSGFNMETIVCNVINYIDFLCYIGMFYFSMRFLILVHRYKVFKNIIYAYLFIFLYIILSVTFSLVAYFTTTVYVESYTNFRAEFNLGLFILIALPLLLIFTIFSYYAFLKCFAKYTKKYKKIHNNENN